MNEEEVKEEETEEQNEEENVEQGDGHTGVSVDTAIISDVGNAASIIKNQEQLFNEELSAMIAKYGVLNQLSMDQQVEQLFQNNETYAMKTIEVFEKPKSIPEKGVRLEKMDYTIWLVVLGVIILGALIAMMMRLLKMEEVK